MEKYEVNTMSVKNALDKFFIEFLDKYQETSEGLPRVPRRKDINQTIYVGDSDSNGYSKWKPLLYGQKENFIHLLETYKIEENDDIVQYFCSYYFLGFDVRYKKYLIAIKAIEVLDDYKRLRRIIDAYTDQEGKITHIMLGSEQNSEDTVVVEVKTGIVKLAKYETGKMRKIASSLEEFIQGWETVVI